MNQEVREEVIRALIAKGATRPCSRCGTLHFEIVTEVDIPIPDENAMLPAVIVACTHCGFISQHALGRLGIQPGD
ncbi:hypothetical protein [Limnoglobus roseus]|uniref:Uncharacterized protein n=1 Tax=Limnoglobus roseus TaxID=2598579 RepID=A0A5C1A829_9BACT|nr:hypothetical protein [Limnoglobus roseus]QEL14146.1 hypothetical protein PX52LOC_01016 [Limnoglobus roseus]